VHIHRSLALTVFAFSTLLCLLFYTTITDCCCNFFVVSHDHMITTCRCTTYKDSGITETMVFWPRLSPRNQPDFSFMNFSKAYESLINTTYHHYTFCMAGFCETLSLTPMHSLHYTHTGRLYHFKFLCFVFDVYIKANEVLIVLK